MGKARSILTHELDQLRSQIASLESEMSELPDYGIGDASAGIARREVDRALLEQLRARAADIESMVSDLDRAGYGTCERCGERIHPDRLAVLPGTRTCSRCASGGGKNAATGLRQGGGRGRGRAV
jgi:RNA polymerase-binding transcription factor DksA